MTLAPEAVTLGLLAGGRATRLGGRDKAWLRCRGQAQVLRLLERFTPRCAQVRISANRDLERYARHGLSAVSDRQPDLGPIAGLDALAAHCPTPWLFTLPVDVVDCEVAVLDALAAAAGAGGAVARDADGLQPLVALYRVDGLRAAVASAIAAGLLSVRGLQAAMGLPEVVLHGVRLGNLNTPADLAAAGCAAEDGADP